MATETTEETPFVAADLIGPAGVGSNGQKLVDTLNDVYSPEFEAVLLLRPNDDLRAELLGEDRHGAFGKVSKITGVEPILDVNVRGGADENGRNVDSDAAYICYVSEDARGDVTKGYFPFGDFEGGKTDEHVSQAQTLANSPAGRDHAAAQAKIAAAADAPAEGEAAPDPIAALSDMKASELVALMEAHPERAEAIKAYEEASRSEPRKSVMEFEPEKKDEKDAGSGDGAGDAGGTSGDGSDGGGPAPPAPQ